jgi:rhamnulokinase
MNTLFQLFSMVRGKNIQLEVAHTMLTIPDLFTYWLCAEKAVEYTSATTTEMLRKGRMEWSLDLLRRLRIPSRILPRLATPGSVLAPLRAEIAAEAGLSPSPTVFAVAAHDTASAVAAIPDMDVESAFISSGTWSLIGVETSAPVTTQEAFQLGFTNEGGVNGSVLLLRMVAGLWMLQECMRRWHLQGHAYTWQGLIQMTNGAEPFRSLINPEAAEFLAPVNMLLAICSFCEATNQPKPGTLAEFVRCCIESLSLCYREIIESLDQLAGRRLSVIRVVGGGSQNQLLCQLTADATGRMVVAGPVEAAALGNIMMQAVAAGDVADASEGRRIITASVQRAIFKPRTGDAWDEAYSRFRALPAKSMDLR